MLRTLSPLSCQATRADAGGHYPGLEHPDLLADHIRAFDRDLAGT
jgi:hypothetical protein